MRKYAWLASLVLALVMVGWTGCAKKDQVDTTKLEQSFQSSDPAKPSVDKAVAAIKSADYGTAMAELNKAAGQIKLTPEQQTAIKDVLGQVETKLKEAAGKAIDGANKAIGDLQNALPK